MDVAMKPQMGTCHHGGFGDEEKFMAQHPDDATQDEMDISRIVAYKVLAGEDLSVVAAQNGLDESILAGWVALIDKAAGLALGAEVDGRYLTGEFFQLTRLVNPAGVSLHSLDRVECVQGPPDDNGASKIEGVAYRVVDNIDAGPDRRTITKPGDPNAVRFAFEGRFQAGKAIGMFWSCAHDHESRGTFMLNQFGAPGHALSGSYARMDIEPAPNGTIVSMPIDPIVNQLFWSRWKPEDDWKKYLSEAIGNLAAAPAPQEEEPSRLRRVVERGRGVAVDYGHKGAERIRRIKEIRDPSDVANGDGNGHANGEEHSVVAGKEDNEAL